jgi:hypothetical protein
MSGGTMIACAGREIVMGKHSNLGPIDPQFGSWPAIAVLKEFDRAADEVSKDPSRALVWQPILAKYQPTLLSQAQHAIDWSRELGEKALKEGMLNSDQNAGQKAKEIVEFLLSHDLHRAHGRHLHRKELRDKGLVIRDLEDDQKLQDAVLSVHHAFMNTLMNTDAVKIIENHGGVALIRNVRIQVASTFIPIQPSAPPPAPQPQPQPNQTQQAPQLTFFQRLKETLKKSST